jgi:hypothetical protein
MSIASRLRVSLFLGPVLLASAACSGAGASVTPDNPSADEADITKTAKPLTDAELAAAFAKAPAKLSEKQAKQLIDATLLPVATTARLEMLNDFASGRKDDSGSYLTSAMEGIFWGTPRDIASAPAGLGGQTLRTTIAVEGGIAGPTKLEVSGVASAKYTLELTISGYHVTGIEIPAHATATDTAKLIAKALDEANAKIMNTIGDSKAFSVIGGDHAESPSGVDDLEISTSGATVEILVAQNG